MQSAEQLKQAILEGKQLHVGISDCSVYIENTNRFDPTEYIVMESYPGYVKKYDFADIDLALEQFLFLREEFIKSASTIEVW